MVDASVLSDYEVWAVISSILVNGVTGFLVAGLQSSTISFLSMAGVLAFLLVIALKMAFSKRHALTKRTRTIVLKVTETPPNDQNRDAPKEGSGG